jgi:NUDIX domain
LSQRFGKKSLERRFALTIKPSLARSCTASYNEAGDVMEKIPMSERRGRVIMTTTSEHEQFPIREEGQDKLEVHVASVCIRIMNGRPQVLVGRRTASRSLSPGKWECGGGMVRCGEGFDAAIQRQIFEEFGLEIDRVRVLGG